WKIVVIATNLLMLVFALDDLIGHTRMNSFAAAWLSSATRFFSVLVHRIRSSATMLRIVFVVFITSGISVAAMALALRIFVGHMVIGLCLYLCATVFAVGTGYVR